MQILSQKKTHICVLVQYIYLCNLYTKPKFPSKCDNVLFLKISISNVQYRCCLAAVKICS